MAAFVTGACALIPVFTGKFSDSCALNGGAA
jgi:hypothetical protein